MASDGDQDQNAVLRNIIESIAGGDFSRGGQVADNVAHLLAALAAQVGQSIVSQHDAQDSVNEDEEANPVQAVAIEGPRPSGNFEINPQGEEYTYEDPNVSSVDVSTTIEVPTSHKPKAICIKLPLETRKQIISMRKEGRKCKDIAKELKVSASGVQKVWERFLATGMVHDRKPSSYAGRPRKYTFSQGSMSEFDTQFLGDGNMVFQSSGTQVEYVPTPTVVIGDDSEVFTTETLDVPGATVEIVDTPTISLPGPKRSKRQGTPTYRKQLLSRLIEGCPLATLRGLPDADTNSHVQNIATSANKSLYMEHILGYPFGKVPSPKPFEANYEEAQVIFTDPSNPLGKEKLAALGYSTKVYFNACCNPSPLFDVQKLLSNLPISIGPNHLVETMHSVLQLLIDLCRDPVAALDRIPNGLGPKLVARTCDGEVASRSFSRPTKLSEYWAQLNEHAAALECCENFLSASPPSVPCLLCHPYESLVQSLEIKDLVEDSPPLSPSTSIHLSAPPTGHKTSQQLLALGSPPSRIRSSPTRGRPRKISRGRGGGRRQQEERVVNDGQFAMPVPVEQPLVVQDPMDFPSHGEGSSLAENQVEEAEVAVASTGLSFGGLSAASLAAILQVSDTTTLSQVEAAIEAISAMEQLGTAVAERESTTEDGGTRDVKSVDHPDDQSNATSANTPEKTCEDQPEGETSSPTKDRRNKRKTPTDDSTSPQRTRSTRTRSGKRSGEAQVAESPPPAKRTRSARKSEKGKNPLDWGVEEVAEFIGSIPHCDCTDAFKDHEVDGESLLSLDPEMMVKLMEIKTGPALRIHKKITALKKQFGI